MRCPVIKIFNRPIKMLHTFKGVSRVPNSGTLRPRKLRYLGGRKYRNFWKRKFKLPSISLHKNDNWWGMSTKKIDCNLRKRNLWRSNLRGISVLDNNSFLSYQILMSDAKRIFKTWCTKALTWICCQQSMTFLSDV